MAKLLMTVEQMQNKEAWLKARNSGIGGSDAGIIVGLNKWKSPFQLWLEKTGQVEAEDISDNEFVYWGNVLEQVVADEFTVRTGKKVMRRGLLQHDELPWLLASVDRMVVGENAGLECKTANGFASKLWEDDEIPDSYYCQCQHYMAVTGCEAWYIACLLGGNKFIWKRIERNEEDIKALLMAESLFWKMVETKTMPEVDCSDNCSKALALKFKGGQTEPVDLPSKASEILSSLDELKKAEDSIKLAITEKKNLLCEMLGDNEIGFAGERKVTWKPQAGRVTVDGTRLKKDLPDIFNKYKKVGASTRVLRY